MNFLSKNKEDCNKYKEWVYKYYPSFFSAKMQSEQATKNMVEYFPELIRVFGEISYTDTYGDLHTKVNHWWCVDLEGNLVDPTAHQYPNGIINYFPVDMGKQDPTGRCVNCGSPCYRGDSFCSITCEREYQNKKEV